MENESFTNQKRRLATEKDVATAWGGEPNGKRFYCGICGYRFKVGDGWRWVYANSTPNTFGNFFVCDSCDGPDLLAVVQKAHAVWEIAQRDEFVLAAMVVAMHEDPAYPKRVEEQPHERT